MSHNPLYRLVETSARTGAKKEQTFYYCDRTLYFNAGQVRAIEQAHKLFTTCPHIGHTNLPSHELYPRELFTTEAK